MPVSADPSTPELKTAADAAAPAVIDDAEFRRELNIDGARVACTDAGRGEAVVFLHGYPQSRLCWRHPFSALSATHRVLAPDWPGWGESDRRLDLGYGYWDEVGRIATFLDVIGLARANFVVHDYGAHLMMGFVTRWPERIQRLAICNSRAHRSFPIMPWLMFGLIGVLARTPVLSDLLAQAPILALHRLLLLRYRRLGCFDDAQIERYLFWMRTSQGRRWFVRFFQDYRLANPVGIEGGLARFTAPVGIIWGDRDPYCPPAVARDLAARLRQARVELQWVAGADHFVMEQAPDVVTRAIRRLLAQPEREDQGTSPVLDCAPPDAGLDSGSASRPSGMTTSRRGSCLFRHSGTP